MRLVPVLLLAAVLSACLPVPVRVDNWADAPSAPKPGDLVRVRTREGVLHVFRVYKIDETAFFGVARNNRKYRVPYATISTLEVRVRETEWELIGPTRRGILWP